MVWLVSSPYLTEEAAKPCIINTTSRTTQISKEYLSKLHIIWGRGSRSFTTLFFRKGRLPAKMDFRSEVCYLNVDSLEFLAFRWNGYEPEWYFIPNFGHILAINAEKIVRWMSGSLNSWSCYYYSEIWTKMSPPSFFLMKPWPLTLQNCFTTPYSVGRSNAISNLTRKNHCGETYRQKACFKSTLTQCASVWWLLDWALKNAAILHILDWSIMNLHWVCDREKTVYSEVPTSS